MEIKLISCSSKLAAPGLPKAVQVACVIERGGVRESVTKHLHWNGKNYVGRGYGETQLLRFPQRILNGTLKLDEERRAA